MKTTTHNQQADATFALLFALSTPFVCGLAYLGSRGVFNSQICSIGSAPIVVTGSWLLALLITAPLSMGSILIWRYFSSAGWGPVYNALVSQVFCALIMHFGGGSGEAHFPFFIFTSFLLYYRNWRPIVIACVAIGLHHIVFFALQGMGIRVVVFTCLSQATLVVHLAAALVQGAMLVYIANRMATVFNENASLNSNLQQLVFERTSELNEANSKLTVISATDGLTGIANRRHFDELLASEWARSSRTGQPLALLMIDVDLFKSFNDHYGHLAGDECLKSIAQILQMSAQRAGDLAARYGGEEFSLLLANTDAGQAQELAEKVRNSVEASGLSHEHSPFGKVTISIGLAVKVGKAGQDAVSLLREADGALYCAKHEGRNRVVLARGDDA